jgi:hypothetical protein
MYSVVPQSRPSLLSAIRDTERNTEGTGGALSAGVTGENSPHLQRVGKIQEAFRLAAIIAGGILACVGRSSASEQAQVDFSKRATRGCIAQSIENSEAGDE